jgi:hypothetical protein
MALTKVNTDLLADGGKLNGIEAGADVTDTTNVTAAGALMDSELTSIASVKALDQGVATTDSPTFAGLNASGNLTLDVAGDIVLNADGGDWLFNDGAVTLGSLQNDGNNNLIVMSNTNDKDIKFLGIDNSNTITALTLDMSAAGAATFNDLINIGGSSLNFTKVDGVGINAKESLSITIDSDNNDASRVFSVLDGNGTTLLQVTDAGEATFNQGAVFNEAGVDSDFRVESDSNAHMLFVDGGANQVVVGTSSPITGVGAVMTLGGLTDTRLVIDGASSSGLYLTDSGAQGITMRNASGDLEFYGVANKEFAFNENGIDTDFRVESDVYSHMLFVDGGANVVAFGQTANISGGGMYFNHSNATRSHLVVSNTETSYAESVYYGNRQNSDGHVFQFRRQNSNVGNISVGTTGTTYSTTSDRRLKKDIETITDGTDKLMAMNPVTHGWKADPEADAVHGFIAQEMRDIVPEAVSGDPEGEDMMSMDYGRITPVLVAALQDAHKKIAGLETRLNELEGK